MYSDAETVVCLAMHEDRWFWFESKVASTTQVVPYAYIIYMHGGMTMT